MMDGWDWMWGSLMMIVFWGGLAVVVVVGVRAVGSNSRRGLEERETPDAKAVLEARFARGELTEEEFEDRKRVLGIPGEMNRQYDEKVVGAH